METKLLRINSDPYVHRIHARVVFMTPEGSELTPIDAIIDTGAILSLFPKFMLSYYRDVVTEDHTLWGIVDTPECQLPAKLGKANLRLLDGNNLKTRPLAVTGAFSSNDSTPALIGMKDLLAIFSSQMYHKFGVFKIDVN